MATSAGPGLHTERRPDISDYGFLSDCHSAVLVDRSGSVDWWCAPRFDSPSLLGRLLDPSAGHWQLAPVATCTTDRSYIGDTLVLRTLHHTATGTVSVTDALLLAPGARGHDVGRSSPHVLMRRVEGQQGTVRMRTDLSPRMEYGRTEPHLQVVPGGVRARGGRATLTLHTGVSVRIRHGSVLGEFDVAAGEVVDLRLSYAPSFGGAPSGDASSLEDTLQAWRSWTDQHAGYDGGFPEQVDAAPWCCRA